MATVTELIPNQKEPSEAERIYRKYRRFGVLEFRIEPDVLYDNGMDGRVSAFNRELATIEAAIAAKRG